MRANPKSQAPDRAREGAERGGGAPASDRAGGQGGAPIRKEGWEGWDDYAPFYDWENARTLGRRDVPFWRRIALETEGPVLELGCGTGRISLPLARAGVSLVGVDRSAPMLNRARRGLAKLANSLNPKEGPHAFSASPLRRRAMAPFRAPPKLVRGDIRVLPFAPDAFRTVVAPYGVLQSLLADRDLAAALDSVARVLAPGGTFGLDLVPDVPNWHEYSNRVQLRGPAGRGVHLTLIESVRQDRARRLTTFTQRYVERRNGRSTEHCFELTFRTLSVQRMTDGLERAGFVVDRVLGDYRGRPWDARADVWIILAKKR
jgi:SAM-dependent methyltransferase